MRAFGIALWPAMMATLLCTTFIQPVMSAPINNEALDAIDAAQGTAQRQAAERGLFELSNRLTALPKSGTPIFAVSDYQELRRARIGVGFEVNLIDPQALLSGNSIGASTYPSNEWRFMVMVDNQPVGLVTVAPLNGRWKMVSAGASEMAQELSHIVSQYTQHEPAARLRFLRSQQGVADFVEVTPSGKDAPSQYVPLLSARIMLKQSAMTAGSVVPALAESQVAARLRASIRHGLSAPSLAH
ncbi:hypothetical protein [Dyella flagellata]|uniref:Uncharacterized protein n=1 Tax=Dyella flagellata TaxID=1867833 RepID=A0ABQ5X6P4_9GAMM|nr:hypothetical protein [Dyella flagellata]GLQ86821.1 hypothetical protein GCM10007898_03870 [Dyella flagellata]